MKVTSIYVSKFHGLYHPRGHAVYKGEEEQTTLAIVEAYDPQQDRWEAMAPMPEERHGYGAAAVCM